MRVQLSPNECPSLSTKRIRDPAQNKRQQESSGYKTHEHLHMGDAPEHCYRPPRLVNLPLLTSSTDMTLDIPSNIPRRNLAILPNTEIIATL